MKAILFFLIFALNCYHAFSAIASYPPSENPAFPGKCWFEPTKKAYAVNEIFKYGKNFCGQYKCLSSYRIQVETCGVVGAPAGCYVAEGDLSLKYPQCCSTKIICGGPIPREPRV